MYKNLAAETARKGLTDTDVAKMLGISRQLYAQRRENGTLRIKEARLLCDFFDVKFEYLFEDAGEDQPCTSEHTNM